MPIKNMSHQSKKLCIGVIVGAVLSTIGYIKGAPMLMSAILYAPLLSQTTERFWVALWKVIVAYGGRKG